MASVAPGCDYPRCVCTYPACFPKTERFGETHGDLCRFGGARAEPAQPPHREQCRMDVVAVPFQRAAEAQTDGCPVGATLPPTED